MLLIGYYLTALLFFCTGVLFIILSYKFTKEIHKSTDWTKHTTGAWVVGVLPFWLTRLLILALGIFLIYMAIGYFYNVILIPK